MGFKPDTNGNLSYTSYLSDEYRHLNKREWIATIQDTDDTQDRFQTNSIKTEYKAMARALTGIHGQMLFAEHTNEDLYRNQQKDWTELREGFAIIDLLNSHIINGQGKEGFTTQKNEEWETFWILIDRLTWNLHGQIISKDGDIIAN